MTVNQRLHGWSAVCIVVLSLTQLGISRGEPPRFAVTLYGLADAEHVRSDGIHYSGPSFYSSNYNSLLPTGQLRGYSIQILGDEYRGQSSWVSDGRATIRVGLIDADHTGADGFRQTGIYLTNQQAQLAGISTRFVDGAGEYALSAWFYDGIKTRRIGLFEQVEPNDAASIVENASFLNERGQVAGNSTNSSDWHNQQFNWAWIDDPVNGPVQIGLDGEENRNAAGGTFNFVSGLNNRGQAIGLAARKDRDGVLRGNLSGRNQSAWFFDGVTTVQIGYTDDLHTGDFGGRASTPLWITDSGIVAGDSLQFDHYLDCAVNPLCGFELDRGKTAWVYRNGSYRKVGLPNELFVDRDGFSRSSIERISESGFTAGTSLVRSAISRKYVPWVDDGISTHEIEVPQPDWEGSFSSYPFIHALTDRGTVFGSTTYYGHPDELEEVRAWTYANGEVRLIGLLGDEYHGADGSIRNEILEVIGDRYVVGMSQNLTDERNTLWVDDGIESRALEITLDSPTALVGPYSGLIGFNESGQLLGHTYQFVDADTVETKDWVYDPSGQLTIIEVPAGKKLSASGITETGWVYGQMRDGWYNNSDAFLWHASIGLLRLADLIGGSPLPPDTRLVAAVNGMDGNRFSGYAYTGQSSWAFLAVAIPEPASIFLAILGLLGVNALGGRCRRRV